MTYKLNPQLRLIMSPVSLLFDGEEKNYLDVGSLITLEFDKRYVIDSISASDGTVIVTLRINNRVNDITWIGEEAVSFM